MTFYELKKHHGCVITPVRAVQYLGDLAVFEAFGEAVSATRMVEDGAVLVTDKHGDTRFVIHGDFVFEHPGNPDRLEVLSGVNFLDVYRESRASNAGA